MFNTITHKHITNENEAFPYEKTVHNHEAPAADVAKFLRELQIEAYKSLFTDHQEDNLISFHMNWIGDSADNCMDMAYCLMVNGKKFEGCHKVPNLEMNDERIAAGKKIIVTDLINQLMAEWR